MEDGESKWIGKMYSFFIKMLQKNHFSVIITKECIIIFFESENDLHYEHRREYNLERRIERNEKELNEKSGS